MSVLFSERVGSAFFSRLSMPSFKVKSRVTMVAVTVSAVE